MKGMRKMEDKALAYFKTHYGAYALTPKISDKYPEPKHFLVKMSPEATMKHRQELIPTQLHCTDTKTGAKFCILTSEKPKIYMELMEMTRPIWEMSVMAKEHRVPTLEEARELGKNDFLVISIKPEDFGQGEHVS